MPRYEVATINLPVGATPKAIFLAAPFSPLK